MVCKEQRIVSKPLLLTMGAGKFVDVLKHVLKQAGATDIAVLVDVGFPVLKEQRLCQYCKVWGEKGSCWWA